MVTTSVLITTYKRVHLLKWGLESLSQQNTDFEWEVLVLNDGIPDETEELCQEYITKGLQVKYIFTGQRNLDGEKWRVPGFAFNIGAKLSKAPVIILSCAEMYHLDSDSIKNLTEPVLENTSRLTIPKGKDDTGGFLRQLESTQSTSIQIYDRLPTLNVRLPFVMGLNRKRFVDIGGYDEDFTGIAFDDDDIVSRLREDGCHYREVASRVVHLFHGRGGKAGHDYTTKWMLNRNLYRARQGIVYRNLGREWGLYEG